MILDSIKVLKYLREFTSIFLNFPFLYKSSTALSTILLPIFLLLFLERYMATKQIRKKFVNKFQKNQKILHTICLNRTYNLFRSNLSHYNIKELISWGIYRKVNPKIQNWVYGFYLQKKLLSPFFSKQKFSLTLS